MSGPFKIYLVVLTSIALLLGACNDSENRTSSTLNPVNNSPSPTPAASQTPEVSQSAPVTDSRGVGQQAQRSDYQPIALTKISSSHSLQGTDPKAIALAAFSNTEPEVGTQAIALDYPQPNQAVVSITQIGVGDDSVKSVRYRVEFVPESSSAQTNQHWEMAWAGFQVKCQVGRGHQDWSAKNCH